MRIWNINPELLCDQHLIGEHHEAHTFVGCILVNRSLNGYIEKGLVEIHNLQSRHDSLASEMLRRGFNHYSPLAQFNPVKQGSIDTAKSLSDLTSRCEDCKRRIQNDTD